MNLEIIRRAPAQPSHEPPLMFVHGSSHGAWCWENWIGWFADRGHEVQALSLRGHGKSEGREALQTFGLSEYCDDVLTTARREANRPVLVGHSMGGAIAQLAIAAEPSLFRGIVLLASLPPDSFHVTEFIRIILRFRAGRASKKLMDGRELTAADVRDLTFFDNRISAEQAARYATLLQPESHKAHSDLVAFRAPTVRDDRPPMLVIGSSRDALFGQAALKRTAHHYLADLSIMEQGCHDLMLDPVWPEAAEQIHSWLKEKRL